MMMMTTTFQCIVLPLTIKVQALTIISPITAADNQQLVLPHLAFKTKNRFKFYGAIDFVIASSLTLTT